ncbi:serine protease FAM111B-like [Branchiostoma lanceolatum]|uniref:serine protease FAM111B-like n=1 Tax=Branchiostoma lanceolatum TaxID=7740 RepID=UPI0034531261
MYPDQNGAVVLDCLQKADPSLKQLVLKTGYKQRCIPMDQTEEVQASLEGNITFTWRDSMAGEITFQHPKSVRGDLNKKEVFLSLRDGADPNHLGYITYSIAQRQVTQMPISVTAGSVPNISKEVLGFCRLLTSSLGVNFVPLSDQKADMERVKKISEWETNFASRQSCRLSDRADDLINYRKRAVCKIDWPTDGHGTGFLIGQKEIITNYHVLKLMREAYETNRNPLEYKATFHISGIEHVFHFAMTEPLSWDDSLDYAILELDSEPDSTQIPTLGQYISRIPESTRFAVVVGHPFGGSRQLDYCHMASVDEKFAIHVKFGNPQAPRPNPDLVSYHSHEMYFGSSGSPGFNTDGNVILLHAKGYFPYYNSPSVIEQGVKLTSIIEHARSNLSGEKFDELFPMFSFLPQGNPLIGGDEMMETE